VDAEVALFRSRKTELSSHDPGDDLVIEQEQGWNNGLAGVVEDHIVKLERIICAISDDTTGA
jgi:hypothetical protein